MGDDELAVFLDSGPAILGASTSPEGPPEAFRCWGARLDDDLLRVYISSVAELTLARLAPGARLAFIATDVVTFHSVQLKGSAVGGAEAPDRADAEAIRRYTEAFSAQIVRVGHPPSLPQRLRPMAVAAASVRIEHLFDQTPGPKAGIAIRSRSR